MKRIKNLSVSFLKSSNKNKNANNEGQYKRIPVPEGRLVAKNVISKLEPAKYKYCEILKYFKLLNIKTKPKNTPTNNEDNVQNRVLIKKKKKMI